MRILFPGRPRPAERTLTAPAIAPHQDDGRTSHAPNIRRSHGWHVNVAYLDDENVVTRKHRVRIGDFVRFEKQSAERGWRRRKKPTAETVARSRLYAA